LFYFNAQVTDAVKLLASMNWNYESDTVFKSFLFLSDWLLQQPLSHNRESIENFFILFCYEEYQR